MKSRVDYALYETSIKFWQQLCLPNKCLVLVHHLFQCYLEHFVGNAPESLFSCKVITEIAFTVSELWKVAQCKSCDVKSVILEFHLLKRRVFRLDNARYRY